MRKGPVHLPPVGTLPMRGVVTINPQSLSTKGPLLCLARPPRSSELGLEDCPRPAECPCARSMLCLGCMIPLGFAVALEFFVLWGSEEP